MESEEKRPEPVYKIEPCWFCFGTSVQATEGLCKKWQQEYLEIFEKASRGATPDIELLRKKHIEMSKILANYPPCEICGGEGGIKVRLPDDHDAPPPFFEGGDGWLRSDNSAPA